jgi:hypothetical protein
MTAFLVIATVVIFLAVILVTLFALTAIMYDSDINDVE